MVRFLLTRLTSLMLTLLAASVVIFLVIEVVPGDVAAVMLGLNATPEALAALRDQLGLNDPAYLRYVTWVAGLFVGDFGLSHTYRVPVAELISARLWVSLPLAIYALLLSTIIAIPIGLIAATRAGKPTDTGIMGLTQLGIAVPNFWFAMFLVLIFAINLRWFPAGGFPGWDEGFWNGIIALTLPAVALAVQQASIMARVTRSATLDTLGQDYIRTARAKGLSRRQTVVRHALRNALIPVLTILGLQFSFLLAGAIIIENVFFLPGLGRLIFQAITQNDL
ncbi:MAG: peptide/nickel transport system permease protein, partial [Dinoroseobacter sp.]